MRLVVAGVYMLRTFPGTADAIADAVAVAITITVADAVADAVTDAIADAAITIASTVSCSVDRCAARARDGAAERRRLVFARSSTHYARRLCRDAAVRCTHCRRRVVQLPRAEGSRSRAA